MRSPSPEEQDTSAEELAAYRACVATLGAELAGLPAEAVIDVDWLTRPELLPVLRRAGDPQEILQRAVRVITDHTAGSAATARNRGQQLNTFLLQQIDLAWWCDQPDILDDEDLARHPEMVTLSRAPGFRWERGSDHLWPRARGYLRRNWVPAWGPGGSGIYHPYARPELLSLLRAIAQRLSDEVGEDLWVNSLTRPVTHQIHLQELGFTAFVPSAHCRGWAADLEAAWYEPRGTRAALELVLTDMERDGWLNAIDEGRIWHVCPSPAWVSVQRGLAG